MAKQNGRRSLKAQLKPPLTIPPRAGAYHRGLQDFVEPFGVTSQKGKVTVVFVSDQRTKRPIKVRGSRERFFKDPVRHN